MRLDPARLLLEEAIAESEGRRAWLASPGAPLAEIEHVCWQRAAHLALAQQGIETRERLDGLYDAIATSPLRSKLATLGELARAWLHLKEGGSLWFCAHNREGGKSYAKRLKLLGEAEDVPRRHCRLVRLVKSTTPEASAIVAQWLVEASPRFVPELGLVSRPGIFSWNRPDRGTALLVEWVRAHRAEMLAGEGMDLGCGAGWAAIQLAPSGRVHLVEADLRALRLAARNAARAGLNAKLHWLDAEREPLPACDWLICNPPHHRGARSDVGLGRAVISAAVGALREGGVAWIVAGRRLPYEATLNALGVRWTHVFEGRGYKIFEVRK